MIEALVLAASLGFAGDNLGSPDWKTRETATQILDLAGFQALDTIREVLKSNDPEIRHRAKILWSKRYKEYRKIREGIPLLEAWSFFNNSIDPLDVPMSYAERITPDVKQLILSTARKLELTDEWEFNTINSMGDTPVYTRHVLTLLKYRSKNMKHPDDYSSWEPKNKVPPPKEKK